MKVLALRGENLASLRTFEVDFDRGPLAETRIFAITGPTGAGKSTLLDALCLALYDRAPRLFGAKDVLIGENDRGLHGADPRSIMRRGAERARAEVDFVGVGGRKYRATWEVWRARKSFEGRLQSQRLRLLDLTTNRDLSGANKTETLAEIERCVGLSFSEFTRAVLLTQGDFAAFLEADSDQRAALLEKMTGTEVFARISSAAFHRAKDEVDRLRTLESRLRSLVPLPPEARAALKADREANRGRRQSVLDEISALRATIGWFSRRSMLEAEHHEAQVEAEEARIAWAKAEDTRERLDTASRALTLEPVFRAVMDLSRAIDQMAAELDECRAEEADAERRKATSLEASTTARRTLDDLDSEHALLAPVIEQARVLELGAAEATKRHDAARKVEVEKALALKASEEAAESTRGIIFRVERELAALEDWMNEFRDLQGLAAEWPRWSEELLRLESARKRQLAVQSLAEESRRICSKLEIERAAAKQRLDTFEAEITRDEMRLEAAKTELVELRRGRSQGEIHDALHRLAEMVASLEAMQSIGGDLNRLDAQLRQADQSARAESACARSQRKRARSARQRIAELWSRFEVARSLLEVVRAKNRLLSERDVLLVPGAPCPLCGSLSHPLRGEAPKLDARETKLARRTSRIEARCKRVAAKRRSANARRRSHAQSAMTAKARALELKEEIEGKRAKWARHQNDLARSWSDSELLAARGVLKTGGIFETGGTFEAGGSCEAGGILKAGGGFTTVFGLASDPRLGEDGDEDLTRALYELDFHRQALRDFLRAEEKLIETVERTRRELEVMENERRALLVPSREAEARARSAEVDRIAIESSMKEIDGGVDEIVRSLGQAFRTKPDFPTALFDDPPAFRQARAKEVEDFLARIHAKTGLLAAAEEQRGKLALIERDRVRLGDEVKEADEAVRTMEGQVIELVEARSALLGGHTVAEVTSRLRARRLLREAECTAADEEKVARVEEAARAFERRHAVERSLFEARTALDLAERRLEAGLAEMGIETQEELLGLLELGPEWVRTTKMILADLESDLSRSEARLEDRARRLADHSLHGAPSVGASEAARRLEALEPEAEALVEEFARIDAAILRDDETVAAIAGLGPSIDDQRRSADEWAEMNSLIGSSDGKKLRAFAQGLSLDALLAMANRHLAALRPRYRLSRVPGFDMELQVLDLDLGEEARAVSTLSGGETFLISLALALGLSCVSARDVEVDSLFIDEGFGNLDPEALEIALSVLDQIQAEGRTIGVISHVAEVADRIGYQVRVLPMAPGLSTVEVAPPHGSVERKPREFERST